ncbi:RAC serine/threonine-protein kinase-like [Cherax quadricarinatus]|uniref:RAC serine/threonine-protein kinase-like n=1 Tax=Cherax quadricarinatus TaxID=27406 RepID=UPI00237967A1|nr:RAC serine/threonine-protein kinase-like [Cherax quadricarinatus]
MRLGSGPGDVREIQSHHFYEAINWKNVEEKKVTPPFKPQVAGETDTSNFNRDFTGELVHLTPPDHKYYPGVTVEDSESLTFNKFSYQDLSSNLGSSTTSSLHSLGFAEKG